MHRLPGRVAGAIVTYIDERLAENPWRLSKELGGDLAGVRAARNGDYRIIFRIDEDRLNILAVRHRAHAYRPQ